MPHVDILTEYHGSIVLLRPLTSAGKLWLHEHVSIDAMWFGGALACEPRYVEPILQGIADDGLVAA